MKNQIIQFLKAQQEFLSGEEISRQLGISRAAVWKYIEELRKEGYDIEAVSHRGYRLASAPDKLFAQEVQHNLSTKFIGKEFHYYDSVTSTMDIAFRLAVEGAKEGTVVLAETQTKGRGRMGRIWNSPKAKGIYCSIILRPDLPLTEVAKFTLLAGVALTRAVEKYCHLKILLKWPNDLLIYQKKLAGILTELSADTDRVRFIVIGFGLNVNTSASLLPPTATSLKCELKKDINRAELLKEIFRQLEALYLDVKKSGFDCVIKECRTISATIGTRIRLVDAGKELVGQAIDIDDQGALVIKGDNGISVKRMSGDVIHI